jgi:thymidylate kinase
MPDTMSATLQLDVAPAAASRPSFIQDVFAALDQQRVDYAFLRGYELLAAVSGSCEIDLLVRPRHLSIVIDVLSERAFVMLPGWGHAPHHFFIAYDESTATWWKLDIVTDFRYGRRFRCLQAGDADACLGRCRPDHRLSLADEFLGLLLHCLLDRGVFEGQHRARLTALHQELAKQPDGARTLVQTVERWLAPTITGDAVNRAIETQAWRSLILRGRATRTRLFWRAPLITGWRYLNGLSLTLVRPLLFAVRRPGLIVALLGPDGAGKSTLARALIQEKPLRARQIYMGTNVETLTSGLPVRRWTKSVRTARRKGKARRLLLGGLDFMSRLANQWGRLGLAHYHRLHGRLVIFDRYVYKPGINAVAPTLGRNLRQWLLRLSAPVPDLVVVLDAPAHVLHQRKGEHTPERLEQMRQGYLKLQDRLSQTVVIDTTQGADAVKRAVIAVIWARRAVARSGRRHQLNQD